MSETKVCKFCQSEIPKKAKVCPNCKRTLKKGHGCLFSILVFIILICIGIAAALNTNDSIQKDISGVSDKSEYITMDEYNQYELHHKSRLAAKPGLTGMWQVSGRSDFTDFEEIVKMDSDYIKNWNIGLDIKIILKTVLVVLGQKGSV